VARVGGIDKTIPRPGLAAHRLWLLLPVMVGVIGLPLVLSGYWVRVLTGVLCFAALAQAYNLIVGYTGYPAFGHAVFFGVGAYSLGIAMGKFGWGLYASLALAAGVCAAYAALLGIPLLRLRSQYFSVATIGIMFATREIVVNLRSFTNGSRGIVIPNIVDDPRLLALVFYFSFLALVVLVTLVLWLISRNRFGYGLMAIRDDEDAARMMGIPCTAYKTAAWSIAAAAAGVAGALYAVWMSFIEPPMLFDIGLASKSFIVILLGGLGTLIGPIVAAALLEIASELIWGRFPEINMLLLGVLIVLITVFLPRGLVGSMSALNSLWRKAGLRR
jgi:branched-chain amino acid transport system permease protein